MILCVSFILISRTPMDTEHKELTLEENFIIMVKFPGLIIFTCCCVTWLSEGEQSKGSGFCVSISGPKSNIIYKLQPPLYSEIIIIHLMGICKVNS